MLQTKLDHIFHFSRGGKKSRNMLKPPNLYSLIFLNGGGVRGVCCAALQGESGVIFLFHEIIFLAAVHPSGCSEGSLKNLKK